MTLGKITIDNSVRYVKKSEQTRESQSIMMQNEKQSEQNQPILGGGKPNMRKQNKKPSRNNQKFPKNFSAAGFSTLTK